MLNRCCQFDSETYLPPPEAIAREKIDALLEAAGWVIQDVSEADLGASLGVAVREFQLPSGPCDYLLFVEGKAAGVIEAKPEGHTLSGVADQSKRYMELLPDYLAGWGPQLRFDYESTGIETLFRDMADPDPRSRHVFAFHKPETLLDWLRSDATLRKRLQKMPPLEKGTLRDCQLEAITGLEASLAKGRDRALIQMATGAGKTFTACNFSYRLAKFAQAKRILFLVDRRNLGKQTLTEFQNFHPADDGRQFSKIYNVQQLTSNKLDPDAKVVISTIQRVFAMLRGEELDEEEEEGTGFGGYDAALKGEVEYNPQIPPETYDVIIVDECHRSIYGKWRQVLDYFDAFTIGLTATPSKQTLGFFGSNLVSEYPYERSVADGVNVGFEVYRIRTEVTERGGQVDAGYHVGVRDKRTRKKRYEELDEELLYSGEELDRKVLNPNQIRTVLETFRDKLYTDLFPGRSGKWVPKTLIFAKDDHHAEEIVTIAREVFDQGNDFCKKITYRATGDKPENLISAFRVDPMPRIAVTVDMIATGTDVKPVEVLIFMRDVKSENYYEQMRGRGVRTILDSDLQAVTPDAQTKTRFVLIDPIGVSESKKVASQPLEREPTVPFQKLLERVAFGDRSEDTLSSLAARLAALDRRVGDEDRRKVREETGGRDLRGLANALLDSIDPDKIETAISEAHGPEATDAQRAAVIKGLQDAACSPFKPGVRNLLQEIKEKAEIVIDEVTQDTVISTGYDLKIAEEKVERFREFIEANKDELLALQVLYSRPRRAGRLTHAAIKELAEKLADPPWHLMTADVWQAYRRLDESRVKGVPSDRMLTDIISLVRFAIGTEDELTPFAVRVEQRFNLWRGRQLQAGKTFTEEQDAWLRLIMEHIAANTDVTRSDLIELPQFTERGGLGRAKRLFGEALDGMLDDLSGALVA